MKSPYRTRLSNLSKLKEASKIGLSHPVLLCLDMDELKTLSLAPWMTPGRDAQFRRDYQDLGVFRQMPQEPRYALFLRMWEEAEAAGALLGGLPGEGWVVVGS
ncbi:MAG: hypothetical protein V4772_25670 [Pseudomonadota bacterium]